MPVKITQKLGTPLLTAALLSVALAFSVPAAADYNRGMTALQAGNYNVALMEFQDAAQAGHSGAQMKLGDMYRLGQGTTPNLVEAIKWMTLAYLDGVRETLPTLEMLRESVTESELVEAEQAALKWLEDANRVMFADDDTTSLYEQF
jgi:TPR repeat protein